MAADSYRGFSAHLGRLLPGAEKAAQPIFIGRVLWPAGSEPEDVVVKLYEASSCGVANETIGYIVNALRGIRQPRRGGILLLSKRQLPDLNTDLADFIDTHSGLAACWISMKVTSCTKTT
ncbi:hypothetical protein [Massilia rubra]|uniref:Uncharacterized protein n=1 Tax=Massilia rubra TaxID=2607910 RepID=A0ABX0LMN0_9BURK|nr:hypothetical protein [Massilia rubra]NHZ33933.1 hypothetical protein [Massilia rubra]